MGVGYGSVDQASLKAPQWAPRQPRMSCRTGSFRLENPLKHFGSRLRMICYPHRQMPSQLRHVRLDNGGIWDSPSYLQRRRSGILSEIDSVFISINKKDRRRFFLRSSEDFYLLNPSSRIPEHIRIARYTHSRLSARLSSA